MKVNVAECNKIHNKIKSENKNQYYCGETLDMSKVRYYKYNKNDYYANKFIKLLKKLVLVSATSTSLIKARKKDKILIRILFIYYMIRFKAFIYWISEINAKTSAYASKFNFRICYTYVGEQKIDTSIFVIFEIVAPNF